MSQHEFQGVHPAPTSFFRKYIWSYDHKVIGKQYLFTGFFFLLLGGLMAMLMRWQLAYPNQPVPIVGKLLSFSFAADENGVISPEGFLQLVTLHGTLMVFFVIIPIVVGAFGNFLIPLQIGARDVAFPFLNALSYWIYLAAGLVITASLFAPKGPAMAGWTAYPPLSDVASMAPGSGLGQDLWLIAVFLVGFSSILGGVNFLTTVVKLRAPGMTWGRIPLVTWAQIITAVFQTLATPALASATALLMMDKFFGTNFFLPSGLADASDQLVGAGGGHPLLWQHVFWFYSHPAVYILILPAMGITSEIISTFSRKPIFAYSPMVLSMASIMGLGFIVWGHHMFVSGMSPAMGTGFMVTTMLVALPSGVKVFNWLGTLWRGSLRLATPMWFGLGFVSMFIIGGLSGLFMAATPVDVYIHDTYYIVAHFHYIVFGGTLMAVFGGLYFWFPKLFAKRYNEFWGKVHFWLTFVFFNLTFFPMHFLGEGGHIRRISSATEYEFMNSLQDWNVFISLSAFVLGVAQLIFLINFFYHIWKGKKAEVNPWECNTLEWTLPVPIPYHNFDHVPVVYRGPYEYSSPEAVMLGKDWIAQNEAPVTSKGGA